MTQAPRPHAKALESGKTRIEALKHDLAEGGATFSTLSAGATAQITAAGLTPLGIVMGSSVTQLSLRYRWLVLMGFARPGGEMEAFTKGHLDLRARALDRLRSEAAQLGAHGVIDVKIELSSVAGGFVEYKAMGTAVRVPDRPEDARKAPFTSDFSGSDYCKLRAAGGWPVDVVYGISVQWVRPTLRSWAIQSGWWFRNVELERISEAMATARHQAMRRMNQLAKSHGASHVVGADVWYEVLPLPRGYAGIIDYVVIYFTRGTAIRAQSGPPQGHLPKPLMILDLATGASSALQAP